MIENYGIPERKPVHPLISDKDVEFQGGFLLYSLGAVSLFLILAAQARADFESAVARLEAVSRVLDLDAQTAHRRRVRVGRLLPEDLQVLDGRGTP